MSFNLQSGFSWDKNHKKTLIINEVFVGEKEEDEGQAEVGWRSSVSLSSLHHNSQKLGHSC